ncbi:MAG: prepilin-type N-terminal cleavage/methylation domain-containing protein [Phycisphaerales bacterium]|nr:prepilin-type N-terminal cleavage/methylation domain-containing protein [Phycisphaerales bacterium]
MARRKQSTDRRTDRGFTLIELLVVIAIIGVLMGIAVVVGQRVVGSGKNAATQDTIRALDLIYNEHLQSKGANPPKIHVIEDDSGRKYELPLIDARLDSAGTTRSDEATPSLARYLNEAALCCSTDSIVKSLDTRVIQRVRLADVQIDGKYPEGVTVVDAWGAPIRFVHPAFDGGAGDAYIARGTSKRPLIKVEYQNAAPELFRRSAKPYNGPTGGDDIGDADEGIVVGGRGYFYSAGADGDPGVRGDNVYTTKPQFPNETKELK